MRTFKCGRNLVAGCAVAAFSTLANAQWVATVLHPAGAYESTAQGVMGQSAVGLVRAPMPSWDHACLWDTATGSSVDLHPSGARGSAAIGVFGDHQVGWVTFGAPISQNHAAWWEGTAGSFVDLAPVGSTSSHARGVHGEWQVGSAEVDGVWQASLWSGSAESWTSLHPPGVQESLALDVFNTQQVGGVYFGEYPHASLWHGSAESWVDLQPPDAEYSLATGTCGTHQVGFVAFQVPGPDGPVRECHASMWRGSASSWVSLRPSGALRSFANKSCGEFQVGNTQVGEDMHACFWSGTAESCQDLAVALEESWGSSAATGVWCERNQIHVVGFGFNRSLMRSQALHWTRQLCPADNDANGTVDIDDLLHFLVAFELGDASADKDNGSGNGFSDGGVDVSDLLYYLTHFGSGC